MSARTKNVEAALRVLEFLAGHAVHGGSNKDIATGTDCSPVMVVRACTGLMAQGWVRRSTETERFHITPAFARLSYQVDRAFGQARQELDDRHSAMRVGH